MTLLTCASWPVGPIPRIPIRRKERETKKPAGPKKKKAATKRGAPAKGKKAPPAKKTRGAKKKAESESEDDDDDFEGEEAPDTSADGLLAQSLAGKRVSTRNLDKKGKHFKKQAALARIREVRFVYFSSIGFVIQDATCLVSERHFYHHADPGK